MKACRDNRWVVTGSVDNTARLWLLQVNDLVDLADGLEAILANREQTMKTRSLLAFAGLAISFALPIYTQQEDVADPQTSQKIGAIFKALNEAQENHDPAAYAANFTRRDAILAAAWEQQD